MAEERERDLRQEQTQQAAPAATATASEDPSVASTSEQVPEQQGLPTENPPVPTDYTQMHAVWWNGNGPYTIASNQIHNFPTGGIYFSPPVRGSGVVRNELTFSFDVVSGKVTAVVGVTNPSEYNRPMKPFVGVCYPSPTEPLGPGHWHLIRIDIIDQSSMPADIRSWEMNPGWGGGSGRNRWPSLAPYVTAVGGTAVVRNVQIQSYAMNVGG